MKERKIESVRERGPVGEKQRERKRKSYIFVVVLKETQISVETFLNVQRAEFFW